MAKGPGPGAGADPQQSASGDRRAGATPPDDGQPVVADGMMPLWAVSLGWELRRGRQVILNGQIRDRWWFDDSPASFREVVAGTLAARGAEVVGWWDPVGGLTFPLPEHAERFDRLAAAPPATGRGDGAVRDRAGTGDPGGADSGG
ncbi:AAA family ATPase, partial [Streptomyces nanshensis]